MHCLSFPSCEVNSRPINPNELLDFVIAWTSLVEVFIQKATLFPVIDLAVRQKKTSICSRKRFTGPWLQFFFVFVSCVSEISLNLVALERCVVLWTKKLYALIQKNVLSKR